jgi:hypothetical protein
MPDCPTQKELFVEHGRDKRTVSHHAVFERSSIQVPIAGSTETIDIPGGLLAQVSFTWPAGAVLTAEWEAFHAKVPAMLCARCPRQLSCLSAGIENGRRSRP